MLGKEISHQFRAAHLEGNWIATNLKTQLSDVSYTEATTKIGSLNTIAALAYHVNYYVAGVNKVLEGGKLTIRDKYSFNIPDLKNEGDWLKLLDQIMVDAERFAKSIESLSDKQLMAPFEKPEYGNYYKNIHAMIQHVYYHSGQIAILKKMIKERRI